ncbi:MAG: APC family permease [Candidatus Eisenbacteria bacterium]|nr:APC family permease [Candidatus Eisenbacteria bacterium]
MRSLTDRILTGLRGLEQKVLGREKSPLEKGIFHHISLIAFFAWVGLGADGLSSSCYGPEEAYRALGEQVHLAPFLAIATAITVGVIAASYSLIIELFPSGGGGYQVATRLLSPRVGVVSGCALIIDYVLTIAVSVASGIGALLSFFSRADSPLKVPLCIAVIFLLVLLNLRGVKESITTLLPIFIVFVLTHAILIFGGFFSHLDSLPGVVNHTVQGTQESIQGVGLIATLLILFRAYSMGAGTYTGIEAVSNGLRVLREPRVRTGKRTMLYMAVSLAVTAGGILFAYRLYEVGHTPGRTLNATLLHAFADPWNSVGIPLGSIFVALALLSEGLLLFVAAQTGFVGGPQVLASMAVDRWMPTRFANLSSRLVTGNGVLLMGTAAGVALLYTKANVSHLVLMYSINVFVTFTLSQLGMVRHWWQVRRTVRTWLGRFVLNGTGLTLSFGILIVTVLLKFAHGGWVTVVITGSLVGIAFLIKRHYRRVGLAAQTLNLIAADQYLSPGAAGAEVSRRPLALFVNRYDGLGLITMNRALELFSKQVDRIIFLSVAQVDSDQFQDEEHLDTFLENRRQEIDKFVRLARQRGYEAESHLVTGTDVVAKLESLALATREKYPATLFVAGQVVFERETFTTRLLHNEVAFGLQKRLIFQGLDVLILPVTLPEEAR